MLRLLTVLLWLPISAHAFEHQIDKQDLRLELSEILSRMDSSESILFFSFGYGMTMNLNESLEFEFDTTSLEKDLIPLNREYESFKASPYTHSPLELELILKRIYGLLLKPAEGLLKSRITLVLDSSMDLIPWNILIDNAGNYMLDKHEITILPLEQLGRRNISKKDRRNLSVFVLAPEFSGLLAINNDLEKEQVHGKFNTIAADASAADVIHISSHGYQEGLHLSNQDDLLCKEDIYHLGWEARLIFLNTCYSGQIAREFVTEGAEAAVGTQWQVDDKLAYKISDRFYDAVMNGESNSAAIRIAALDCKKNSDFYAESHPFQWGGYYAYGATDELVDSDENISLKKIISMLLSVFTSLSVISYYFGDRVKSKLLEYNLV